jgi:hypothetical protein
MYGRLCECCGRYIDRCVLYAFRSAVYSVSRERRDPKLLKWWHWKDKKPEASRRLKHSTPKETHAQT